MKKVTVILAVVALMISTNLFAQNNSEKEIRNIAEQVIQAFKTQDWQLMKKITKSDDVDENYFNIEEHKKYIELAKNWDGSIKDIHYAVVHLGYTLTIASVYVADVQDGSNNIYSIPISKKDDNDWQATAEGIVTLSKSKFDSYNKELKTTSKKVVKDKFVLTHNSIEVDEVSEAKTTDLIMHPQDKYFNTVQLKYNDDYLLAKYILGKYLIDYKESGVIYESKNKLSKEQTVALFKKYLAHDPNWNKDVEWKKFKSINSK